MEPLGLSLPDTGKALGGTEKPLSRTSIYRLIDAGKLRRIKVGSRTLISVDSIRELASSGYAPAQAA